MHTFDKIFKTYGIRITFIWDYHCYLFSWNSSVVSSVV